MNIHIHIHMDTIMASIRTNKKPNILIVGLGNLLLQDDGVGVHIIHGLQKEPPPNTVVADVGCAVLDALHLFEAADYILAVDAMQAGNEPGTIYTFGTDDVDEQPITSSLHELSLLAALRFIPHKETPKIVIFGVEPDIIDYGLELSDKVKASVPHLIAHIRALVDKLNMDSIESVTAV
jgi:hydrogenase maturation protease